MNYPKSRKSCIKYAEDLSKLHGVKWFPIERIEKIKNKFALNFAAEPDGDDLTDYLRNGWEKID